MKVALVTDSLVAFGGADRVLKSLLKIYPDADIYTSIFNPKMYPWINEDKVLTSFIQGLPLKKFFSRHYIVFSPLAFEQFRFDGYDLVISLSAGCAKGVITGVETRHIGIILTPPRYQWGGEINARASRLRSVFKFLAPYVDNYLRVWDLEASKRPDELISISNFIKTRVDKYYKRDSEVIYLGIDLNDWFPSTSLRTGPSARSGLVPGEYYFIASRLYDYKRIDLAIMACNKLKRNLVVMGSGPDERYLKKIAGGTITFLPYQSDDSIIREYMSGAKAFLFPGVEDFGLTPIESMACGTPVIALKKGGVSETVLDGKTGVFFQNQTVEDLVKAIVKFEGMSFNRSDIIKRGNYFSEDRFIKEFKKFVEK